MSGRRSRLALAIIAISTSVGAAGCANLPVYTPPPDPRSTVISSVTIDKPIERVWSDLIPRIGENFFVINNMDKSSGFLNVGYSGDPATFVSCGQITITASSLNLPMQFRAEQASVTYPYVRGWPYHGLMMERQLSLEGRINIVLQALTPERTKVAVTTRYVLTRDISARDATNGFVVGRFHDAATFNSNQRGDFPPGDDGPVYCYPTGRIETQLLNLVR